MSGCGMYAEYERRERGDVDRYLRRLPDQTYPQCPVEWERTRLGLRDRQAGCRLGERFRCMGPEGHDGDCDAIAENWTADGTYEPVRILDPMRSAPVGPTDYCMSCGPMGPDGLHERWCLSPGRITMKNRKPRHVGRHRAT